MATYDLREKAIVLHRDDDVAIAKAPIPVGTVLEDGPERITVRGDIRPGHKVARRARPGGDPVRRYGQVIGFATAPIAPRPQGIGEEEFAPWIMGPVL